MSKRLKLCIPAAAALFGLAGLVPAVSAASDGGTTNQGAVAKPNTESAKPSTGALAGPAPECFSFAASSPQTRVVTDDFARLNFSTAWTTLPCGSTSVAIPRGRTGLVTTTVDAEVSCQGPDREWCQGRVLIGGAEGEPNAPEPDSFAWANGEPNLNQWEGNSFTRTRRLACPADFQFPTCTYGVVTQVRNHAAGMIFRVDDRTMKVQVAF